MGEIIEKSLKKSSVNAVNDFDFYQIERKSDYLIPCKTERTFDEVKFIFNVQHEQLFKNIRNLGILFKYQALLNIQNLIEDAKRVYISLNPGNLLFDINMMPKAIMRDVYTETKFNEKDFINQYKALIGFTLQTKYSYEDYYQGGNQLLNKNKNTQPYFNINTLEELVEKLHQEYVILQEKFQKSLIEIDKKKFHRLKLWNRCSTGLLIILLGVSSYFGGFRLYEETLFRKANEAYIKQDYISVKEILDKGIVSRMNTNTKYILAVSNIKMESLTNEQKNNILSSVSLNSDVRILEFWIYLGKTDMETAIDIAKQLGNEEYIAYGYMKEKARIENDATLSGSEREEKLKAIENSLKELEIGKEQEESNN